MKAALFLAAISIVSVDATGQIENAQCALDGAKAASELSDVVVYMWAATSRCTQDNIPPAGSFSSPKCAVDISAVIKAVNDMVLIIVKAVNDCADIKTMHYDCGMAVGKLLSASAGISKATANTLHHCPSPTITGVPLSEDPIPAGIDNGGYTDVGKCVVDVKAASQGLFAATLEASKIKSTCGAAGGMQCGRNALHLVAALGDVGSAIGLGINKCEHAAGKAAGNQDSACFGAVTAAVTEIVKATDAGLLIKQKCTMDAGRLYELENATEQPEGQPVNTMLVGALIPIFAVFSFVAGTKFRRGHVANSERSRAMQTLVGEGETTEADI
jgi:hypothetical protein